jgi:hypothetical protein
MLNSGAPLSGVVQVRFIGTDLGAGLSETAIVIDGEEIPRRPIDGLTSTCAKPFVYAVPCPRRAQIAVPIDTRAISNGTHTFQVATFDAAGNRGLSRPVLATVNNPAVVRPVPPRGTSANGSPASRFVRLRSWFAGRSKRTVRTIAYGQSTRVEGTLQTVSGAPIARAALTVAERVVGFASRARPVATVTTDEKGRFVYRVRAGPSRVVRVAYQAFPEDPGPVAASQTTVHVRAGVSLRVPLRGSGTARVIEFSGRVLGERGTRRALVKLYALVGGPRPRVPVETVRAGADGRFVYRYRFRSIPGPSVYRFEARVPKQTGYPYSEGASRAVVVRGRP